MPWVGKTMDRKRVKRLRRDEARAALRLALLECRLLQLDAKDVFDVVHAVYPAEQRSGNEGGSGA